MSWLAFSWIVEVRRLEEVRDAVEGLVVDEDGADERLLDLDVVRALPVQRLVVGRLDDMGERHRISGFSAPA